MPGSFVDVQALGVDYLAFSFHKMLAPFGVGVLYAREQLLASSLPFLYGGDMIAEGRVLPDLVEYNALPWKYAAGTPNILGTIVSAQALRLLLDLALTPDRPVYFGTGKPIERAAVHAAMSRVCQWHQQLTGQALAGLGQIPGLTIYGPRDPARRTSLVAFNLAGRDPVSVAEALNRAGVESRAGCHCATLAHHALGLNPPASCRLSFYLYNTPGEVDRAVAAVAAIAAGAARVRGALVPIAPPACGSAGPPGQSRWDRQTPPTVAPVRQLATYPEVRQCRPSYRAPAAASRPRSPTASPSPARMARSSMSWWTARQVTTTGWQRTGRRPGKRRQAGRRPTA